MFQADKIIVSGFYRTGTTHVYNIVRNVLKQNKIAHNIHGSDCALMPLLLNCPGPLVIKNHDCFFEQPRQGMLVLFCIRNMVDTIGSNLRIQIRPDRITEYKGLVDSIRAYLDMAEYYAGRQDVMVIDYDKWWYDPRGKINRIALFLGLSLDVDQLDAVHWATEVRSTKYFADGLVEADPYTELRPKHIGEELGRPGSYTLTEKAMKTIEEGKWN